MESKSINRFHSYCKSLDNLHRSVSADPEELFVLEATVQMFCLTFDLSWKVMKDILIRHFQITDYATGSPRENLQLAFTNGLISDDIWLKMLKTRNQLSHDYDGVLAREYFQNIVTDFYPCFCDFREKAAEIFASDTDSPDSFQK